MKLKGVFHSNGVYSCQIQSNINLIGRDSTVGAMVESLAISLWRRGHITAFLLFYTPPDPRPTFSSSVGLGALRLSEWGSPFRLYAQRLVSSTWHLF